MYSEAAVIAAGSSFSVALELKHPAEWHSYYKNSGGVELPPSIEWDLPPGFRASPIQWPVPEVKEGYAGKSFIYSGSPVFLVDLRAPEDLEPGSEVTISAKASWQICKESCINEDADFSLSLPVGVETRMDEGRVEFFKAAREALPLEVSDLEVKAVSEGGDIVLRIEGGGAAVAAAEPEELEFIPNEPYVRSLSAEGTAVREDGAWVLTLKRNTVDFFTEEPIPQGETVSGILIAGEPVVVPETEIIIPAAQAAEVGVADPTAAAGFSMVSYLPILGGMFLGGLILNLMPCVFPIIGIKIMGFVQQAGHDRKKIVLHGVIFAAGVIISFWLLALALYLGGITNWGNQLQDPRVTLVTILIMLLLGMNLFGVFEIGTSATGVGGTLMQKQGIAGTFFSGVLATLIATPCSGPFLGVAIGAAAVLPVVPFFIAFTSMAVGLALPYLVLSIFPSLVERLPRPGGWMISFKQGMSFLLFATAGVFLWIYGAQVFDRNDGQKGLWVMIGLSTVATAAWVYGRWNEPVRSRGVRLTGCVAAAVLLLTGVLMAWPWTVGETTAEQSAPKLEWVQWSSEEEARLLAEGRPVFIDFTAKWCLTCQLNKSRAYTAPVVELMKAKGIVAMRADKTNPNPAIEARLKELGRTAIPVNVLLVPGREMVITPELLSADYLLDLFAKVQPVVTAAR